MLKQKMETKEHNGHQLTDDKVINEILSQCKEGDTSAYDELIGKCEPLIASIADKYKKYCALDDLMQCGRIGLYKAIIKFDSSKGAKFTTYAYWEIKGAILKEINLNSSISMSNDYRQFILKVKRIETEYINTHNGDKPTDEELHGILDDDSITTDDVLFARTAQLNAYSIDKKENDNADSDDKRSLLDKEISINSIQEEDKGESKDETFKNFVFNTKLDQRELFIITRKHGYNDENKIYKTSELAKIMNLSDSRIMQLYRRGINKIKRHMVSCGIDIPRK